MMHLGNLLKDRIKAVNPRGGLLFRVKERDHREPSTSGTIKEAVLEDMIKKKEFKMDRFMIFISHEAARTELQFYLRDGIWTTISGFPRRLVNDHESKSRRYASVCADDDKLKFSSHLSEKELEVLCGTNSCTA